MDAQKTKSITCHIEITGKEQFIADIREMTEKAEALANTLEKAATLAQRLSGQTDNA